MRGWRSRESSPLSISRLRSPMKRNSLTRLALKVISFNRSAISCAVRGISLRTIGFNWTIRASLHPVARLIGSKAGLAI